jgi:hypothetical protein
MDSSVIERLYVEVVLGIPKTESKFAPLTEAYSLIWDNISRDVAEIKAKGGIIAIPNETPSIEIVEVD